MTNVLAETSGSSLVITSGTTGTSLNAQAVLLSDGDIALVWAASAGIEAEIVNAEGSVNVAEFLVTASGSPSQPTLTALANGGFVIAWTSTVSGTQSVAAQIFTADGQTTGSLIQPASNTSSPELAALSNGNFVLGWSGANFQVFTAIGTATTSQIAVPLHGGDDLGPNFLDVLATATGQFSIFEWQQFLGPGIPSTYYQDIYSNAGSSLTSGIDLFGSTTRSGAIGPVGFAYSASAGTVVAYNYEAWNPLYQPTANDVFVNSYTTAGASTTLATIALPTTDKVSSLAFAADGSVFVLAFTDSTGLHVEVIAGGLYYDALYAAGSAPTVASNVALAVLPSGNFLVTWTDATGATDGQFFSFPGDATLPAQDTVAQALAAYGANEIYAAVAIIDTAASIAANEAFLYTLNSDGLLASLTLTGFNTVSTSQAIAIGQLPTLHYATGATLALTGTNTAVPAAQMAILASVPSLTLAGGATLAVIDTAVNLLANLSALTLATSVTLTGTDNVVTASQAAALAGLADFITTGATLTVTDSAANLLANSAGTKIATTVILTGSANTVTAAQATTLAGLANFAAPGAKLTVADTAANLLASANALGLAIATSVVLTGTANSITAAQAATLTAGPQFGLAAGITLNVTDSAANLLNSSYAGVLAAVSSVTLSGTANSVNAAQAENLAALPGFSLASGATLVVTDTAANLLLDGKGVAFATSVVLTNPSVFNGATVLGTGTNFLGDGGSSTFDLLTDGQVGVQDFNGVGTLLGSELLFIGGGGFETSAGKTVIGTGIDLLQQDGRDFIVLSSTGAIFAYEVAASGNVLSGVALTIGGLLPFQVAAGSTVIGSGNNFWGTANRDIFVRSASDQVTAWEFNGAGAATTGHVLVAGSAPLLLDAGSAVLGTGLNFWGTANADVFIRTATGQVAAWEFNAVGVATVGDRLTVGGSPFQLDVGSSILGTGFDLWGTAGHDIVVRTSNGQVDVWEFTVAGNATVGLALSVGGSAFQLDAGSLIIGTGANFWGAAGTDLFVRTSTGQLDVWEFTAAGVAIVAQQLLVGGNPYLIDAGSDIVGIGVDFQGTGGRDMFVRNATNQVSVWEFDSTGRATLAQSLTTGGSAFLLDAGSAVAGTGADLWAMGGADLFVRSRADQLTAWEFNSAGTALVAQLLTVGGAPLLVDPAATVVGTGDNFWGSGNRDVIIRNDARALTVWEFNSAGSATTGQALSTGGAAYTLAIDNVVLGTTNDLVNADDSDLVILTGSGQLDIAAFNSAGVEQSTLALTLAGLPFTVTAAATIVGAGIDQASHAHALILTNSSGQTTLYDLAGAALTAVSSVVAATTATGSIIAVGTAGNNTLTVTTPNTTLIGDGGDDTYDIGATASLTTILNGIAGGSAAGTLRFLSAGVGTKNLWFDRVDRSGNMDASGDDLRVDVLGSNQSVTIEGWFAGPGNLQALSEIAVSSSSQMLDSGLNTLLSAMTSYEANYSATNPGANFNPTTAAGTITDATVLAAVAASWHS